MTFFWFLHHRQQRERHARAGIAPQSWVPILREGYVGNDRGSYGIFEFGGIVWENYRGAVGTTSFIESDGCHIFPVGVPGLFRTAYAPADFTETVNTMGQPIYAKQWQMENGKGTHLAVQKNALSYCTRPKLLMSGTR